MYEKEYELVFENKDENWRKKHDYKNLKDFGYYVDEVNKADVIEKEGQDEDKTDQKLPSRIKMSKSRFNEKNDEVTKNYESKLMPRIGNRNITLKNVKELLEGIINKKIDRNEVREMCNNIVDDANELNKLRFTNSIKKCSLFLYSCMKCLRGLKQKMIK